MKKKAGISYQKRVADINRIYDLHARRGLPNREIWRRYIYPVHGICERTFYNLLKAPARSGTDGPHTNQPSLFDGIDD